MKIQNIQHLDFLGTGVKYKWLVLERNGDLSIENIGSIEQVDESIIIQSYNWKELYGELGTRKICIYNV